VAVISKSEARFDNINKSCGVHWGPMRAAARRRWESGTLGRRLPGRAWSSPGHLPRLHPAPCGTPPLTVAPRLPLPGPVGGAPPHTPSERIGEELRNRHEGCRGNGVGVGRCWCGATSRGMRNSECGMRGRAATVVVRHGRCHRGKQPRLPSGITLQGRRQARVGCASRRTSRGQSG